MNSSESFSSTSMSQSDVEVSDVNHQLLELRDVIQSGDMELLAQQLREAHQLLAYKDEVVHSLTEQLHLREIAVLQLQEDADTLRQECETQHEEVSELRSVCADLRSLLKRQQRRTNVKPVVQPNWQRGTHVFDVAMRQVTTASKDISLGYESHCETVPSAATTKAPPVKAWSASQSEVLHEEVTFCQKLTTFIVASSTHVSQYSQQQSTGRYIRSHRPSPLASVSAVELPHFSVG